MKTISKHNRILNATIVLCIILLIIEIYMNCVVVVIIIVIVVVIIMGHFVVVADHHQLLCDSSLRTVLHRKVYATCFGSTCLHRNMT